MTELITWHGTLGYFIPAEDGVGIKLRDSGFLVPERKTNSYPDLFLQFWDAYHKDRRLEKKSTYTAWKALSQANRFELPMAAKNYTEYIMIESSPKYMKHSKRFITSETYLDYIEKEKQGNTLSALAYWEGLLISAQGFAPAWKVEDKQLAVEDIRQLSPAIWMDKVWIFFSGRDGSIELKKKKLGFHYKVFHGMLSFELANTSVKKPVPCKYCGELGGRHDPGCPVMENKRKEKRLEEKEYEDAKDMDFSFKGIFK